MGFKMTDILPPAGWPNVRQLETNEFATGGSNGNMNEQAKSLAARSELLKQYAALPYESKTDGYALNERVQLATGDIVRSTIPSNVNNPNVDMTGWKFNDNTVESIADLIAIQNPKDGQVVFVETTGQNHTYKDGDWVVSGKGANVFNVLDYIRSGDTNHTEAFRRVSLILQEFGGKAVFPYNNGEPYIVGKQVRNLVINPDVYPFTRAYIGEKIFDVRDATKPIELEFQGCTIRYADGMRFGRWSDTVDEPIMGTGAFVNDRNRADIGCIFSLRNNASVKLSGSANLDGNGSNVRIGGTYGDSGIQTFHKAFHLNFNTSLVNDATIYIKDFLSDGIYTGALLRSSEADWQNVWRETQGTDPNFTYLSGVTVDTCARQGISYTGGSLHLHDCHFKNIGRGVIRSNPQSCIDLEAEAGDIRDALFTYCTFTNSTGYGLVDTIGDNQRVLAYKCKFSQGEGGYAAIQAAATSLDNCLVIGTSYIGEFNKKTINIKDSTFTNQPSSYVGTIGESAPLLSPIINNSSFNIDKPITIKNCKFELSRNIFLWIETQGICFKFKDCDFILNEDYSENGASGTIGNFRNCILDDCRFIDNRADKSVVLRVSVDPDLLINTEIVATTEKTLVWSIGGQQGYFSPKLPKNKVYLGNSYVGLTPLEDFANTDPVRRIICLRNIPNSPTSEGNPYTRGDIILNSRPNNSWLNLTFTSSGYTCSDVWSAVQSYDVGTYTSNALKVYKRVVAGNSTTEPSHASGIVDGWEYFGGKAVYATVGAKVTGLSATSTAAEIVQALKVAGLAT